MALTGISLLLAWRDPAAPLAAERAADEDAAPGRKGDADRVPGVVVEALDVEGVEALEEGGVGGDRAEGVEADAAVVDR